MPAFDVEANAELHSLVLAKQGCQHTRQQCSSTNMLLYTQLELANWPASGCITTIYIHCLF